jgi:hypothetical protein
MTGIVTAFKALSLEAQLQAYPEITAVLNAAKDARRLQLEAEIRGFGFKPGEGKKAASAAPKYRSKKDPTKTYGGREALASWLKDEMAEAGLPLNAFKAEWL